MAFSVLGSRFSVLGSQFSVLRNCLKRVGHGATAPARESRLQPVPATPRLKPGLLGRCPVDQGNQHAVWPTQTTFSDSLSVLSSRFSVLWGYHDALRAGCQPGMYCSRLYYRR